MTGSVSSNVFAGNALSGNKALQLQDSTCTVSSNTFINNYDAVAWYAFSQTATCSLSFFNNYFQNNQYTFYLGYNLPKGYTNQKLNFYNNLVNDNSYSDPSAYSLWQTPTIPQTALALNATAGNYWNTPKGTGYSQKAANQVRVLQHLTIFLETARFMTIRLSPVCL